MQINAQVESLKDIRDLKLARIQQDKDIIKEARKAIDDEQEDINKSYEKLNTEKLSEKEDAIKATEEMKSGSSEFYKQNLLPV